MRGPNTINTSSKLPGAIRHFVLIAIRCFTISAVLAACSIQPKNLVVVDTDMALDDVRAIALLAQDPNIQILIVVTSDGASSPSAGAVGAANVLNFMGLEKVDVAAGDPLAAPAPRWRPMSESIGWSHLPLAPALIRENAAARLVEVINASKKPVR